MLNFDKWTWYHYIGYIICLQENPVLLAKPVNTDTVCYSRENVLVKL
ncbi:MAG: hypothetical protein TECD_00457 [Hyphomicrobiaceae bacterium hypho_1]